MKRIIWIKVNFSIKYLHSYAHEPSSDIQIRNYYSTTSLVGSKK